jgi:ABC-type multidrug transport system fused ATPase/permease subunit
VGLAVVRDLRHHLYVRLQQLGLSYYDRTPAGAIMARLMDDVAAVQNLITAQTLTILADLGTSLFVAAWLFSQSLRLGAVLAAIVPIYVLVFRRYTGRIRGGTTAVRAHLDGIFGRLKEKIDGMLVVKAHAREQEEVAEFAEQIAAAHAPRVQVGLLTATFSSLSLAAGVVGAALVFAVGGVEVMHGRLTVGSVVSASTLAGLLFGPVARLADLAAVYQQAVASFDRLREVLDQPPDIREPTCPAPLGRARGAVELDQVGFGYHPGRPVIWDIRLQVQPGMKVALVGPTGCGKSTLLHLLLRFYDPTWGEIRLDGIPLRRLATRDLRRQIGLVPQEPVLFQASLADNIRYGCPQASEAQVERAARAARVHEFLDRLSEGLATRVGNGGCSLSQGERQRVAIARAFCKDPALVLLDEPTSALDPASERLVQDALADLLRGRTAFIVAHRLSTVVDADLIVVLDGGLMVQRGTHAELLAERDELYARLHARQQGKSSGRRSSRFGAARRELCASA